MQTKRRNEEALGGGFVAAAALQFGVVVVLGKLVERTGLPVASMLAVRFAIAALGLGVTLWALRQPLFPAPGERLPLALLGLIGYSAESSLFFLALDHVMKRTNALAGSMWVSGFAAIGLVAFALVSGNADVPAGGVQWARLAGMGAGTAGAFVALFVGLRRLGPVRTSIVAAMEPLAATILAALFLSEPIRAGVAAGGVLILAGAVAASLARATPSKEPPVP